MAISGWLEDVCGQTFDVYDFNRQDFYRRFNEIMDFGEGPFSPEQVAYLEATLQAGHYTVENIVEIRKKADRHVTQLRIGGLNTRRPKIALVQLNDELDRDSREIRDMIDELRDIRYDIAICPTNLKNLKRHSRCITI